MLKYITKFILDKRVALGMLITLLLLCFGCTTTLQHNSSGKKFYKPPNPISIGVLTLDNKTDNEHRNLWNQGGSWKLKNEPHQALSEIITDEIDSLGFFSKVQRVDVPSSSLIRNLETLQHEEQLDAVLVGELYAYKAGGAPHIITFILPSSLAWFIGIPVIPGYWRSYIEYDLRLVELRTRDIIWSSGKKRVHMDIDLYLSSWTTDPGYWKENNRKLVSNWVDKISNDLVKASRNGEIMAELGKEKGPITTTKKATDRHKLSISSQPDSMQDANRWAVIIGISDYQDTRIPSLRYAAADAKAFYEWLISPEGGRYSPARTKLLLNDKATALNIRDVLFNWLGQALEEDVVTIYFAGHGSPQSPDKRDNLFLLPHDSKYDNISATGFPMWDIKTALKRFIKADKVVVMADACHAGGVGKSFDVARRNNRGLKVNRINSGLQNLSQIGGGICVISASDENQYSQESKDWGGGHGVFTHFLLKGLKGQADYNKDESVNLGELTSYVSQEVRRATKNAQSPTVAGRYDPALTIGK